MVPWHETLGIYVALAAAQLCHCFREIAQSRVPSSTVQSPEPAGLSAVICPHSRAPVSLVFGHHGVSSEGMDCRRLPATPTQSSAVRSWVKRRYWRRQAKPRSSIFSRPSKPRYTRPIPVGTVRVAGGIWCADFSSSHFVAAHAFVNSGIKKMHAQPYDENFKFAARVTRKTLRGKRRSSWVTASQA
jgi:hypothetical protein